MPDDRARAENEKSRLGGFPPGGPFAINAWLEDVGTLESLPGTAIETFRRKFDGLGLSRLAANGHHGPPIGGRNGRFGGVGRAAIVMWA